MRHDVPDLEMPQRLVESLQAVDQRGRQEWGARLPDRVLGVAERWGLTLGRPFQPGGMCSWVAPVRTAGDRHLVLKVGWSGSVEVNESAHELEGLLL